MQGWQTTFLGMRELPRDISDFEMKAFFTFNGSEREAIYARRGDAYKLGLALHIGFLRMSGWLLYAFRVIPVALWHHLSDELGIATSEVVSLRTLYVREKTLFDHQQEPAQSFAFGCLANTSGALWCAKCGVKWPVVPIAISCSCGDR